MRDRRVLGKTRHVHFVGIGGIGMSGIAELLANLGYVVSGSDTERVAGTAPLVERRGSREFMVAEDDESNRSFLKLFPTIAVITNIDHEHLENYGGFDDLQQAFVDFANKTPFYGGVVACVDDAHLAAILPRMTRRVITYGLASADAEVTAVDVELPPLRVTATVQRPARPPHDHSA